MASSKYSSPPTLAIGKIGPYTVFLTPPPTPSPSQSPSPSPSPSPRNIVHPHPSPATPVRPPKADSPRPPPPPVLPPPAQYTEPEDDNRIGFLSSAIARVLHVHSSVDEYVANWLGLNKSRRKEKQNLMKHLAKQSVPVTDFNELTYHFIECAYVHDYNTRPWRVAGGGALPTEVQATTSANGTSFRGYQATPSNQYAAQHGYEGLKGIEEKVMQYLQQPSSLAREKGVHRDELAQRLGVPVEKIMESIRTLEGEGLVYSTLDDFHRKWLIFWYHLET
ncbi:Replication protein A 32 kDa subunit A-like protein [Drosera capensis]